MRPALAALCVALAVAAPMRAATGRPVPPVIQEPFTPLPCPLHPDTTLDVEGCQEMRVLRTDRAIDGRVAAIFRSLRPAAQATFAAGERSWLRHRRRSCLAEAARFAGGSEEPVAYLGCTLARNRAHLARLAAMRKRLGRR